MRGLKHEGQFVLMSINFFSKQINNKSLKKESIFFIIFIVFTVIKDDFLVTKVFLCTGRFRNYIS